MVGKITANTLDIYVEKSVGIEDTAGNICRGMSPARGNAGIFFEGGGNLNLCDDRKDQRRKEEQIKN